MVVENCGLQPRQLLLDLLEGEGLVVGMAVNADIHADTSAARQGSMAVAMQHPGAVVALIPHVEGVVTHYKLGSVWNRGFMKREGSTPVEEFLKLLVVQDDLVMVAREETDVAVEAAKKFADRIGVSKG